MAIKKYEKNGAILYEVYVGGRNARGERWQRRRNNITSLRKAENIEFELMRELAKVKEEAIPYRWHEWLEHCLKHIRMTLSYSTGLNYEKSLNKWVTPHWSQIEIRTITKMQVYDILYKEVDSDLAAHTRKTLLKMIRRVFQMAVEEGCIDRNPCVGIQVKVAEVEQKVLTNTEVEIFLREAHITQHRFFPMWYVALTTGMRSGELLALTWKDIDFDADIISVSKQWNNKTGFGATKTQRNRIVPISEDLKNYLQELKLKSLPEAEFVLPHLPEWLNGEQARITREFCQSLKITPVKFHDLRATFITNLLSRGVPLARVMAIVGHSQLKTTNGYLRKAGVDVKGATEALGYKMPKLSYSANVVSLADRRR
ncbi:MAG: tyrosine-type recombinase/integrase [Pseudobdellovibrio sp.]